MKASMSDYAISLILYDLEKDAQLDIIDPFSTAESSPDMLAHIKRQAF
jgi:hypothetical protein